MSRLIRRPCATCARDEIHVGLRCIACGHDTVLKPVEFRVDHASKRTGIVLVSAHRQRYGLRASKYVSPDARMKAKNDRRKARRAHAAV